VFSAASVWSRAKLSRRERRQEWDREIVTLSDVRAYYQGSRRSSARMQSNAMIARLKHLKERGLKGIRLSTSDACIGLAVNTAESFHDAAWQRCVVHWYRNIFSHVPSTKVREIAAMLKAIHASEDLAAAREKAIRVIEKLRGLRLTRAAELVEAAIEET